MSRRSVQFFDHTGLWSASEGGASSKPAEVSLLSRDFVERVILYKDKVEIVMSEEGLKKLAPHDSPAISATRPRLSTRKSSVYQCGSRVVAAPVGLKALTVK